MFCWMQQGKSVSSACLVSPMPHCEITAKVLPQCKLKYYRISECAFMADQLACGPPAVCRFREMVWEGLLMYALKGAFRLPDRCVSKCCTRSNTTPVQVSTSFYMTTHLTRAGAASPRSAQQDQFAVSALHSAPYHHRLPWCSIGSSTRFCLRPHIHSSDYALAL